MKAAKNPQQLDFEKALAAVPVTGNPYEYMLSCVLAMAPELSQAITESALRATIQHYGQQSHYLVGRYYKDIEARNASIRADYWQKGERIPLLERRYGISKTRLWEIIKS